MINLDKCTLVDEAICPKTGTVYQIWFYNNYINKYLKNGVEIHSEECLSEIRRIKEEDRLIQQKLKQKKENANLLLEVYSHKSDYIWEQEMRENPFYKIMFPWRSMRNN